MAHAAGQIAAANHPDRVRDAMNAFAFDLHQSADGYLEIPGTALPVILDDARGWLDEVLSDCWREFISRAGLQDHGTVATK